MANFRITELDFDEIKENLKDFLLNYRDSNNELVFADYDFEASSISILLDILAYNTHYNAYLANMVTNETFLDSSVKRESAVSIAKHLGYSPLSYRSSRATVTFSLVPTDNPSTLTLPRYSPFVTTINGSQYTFVNLDPVTIIPEAGQYVFRNAEIVEGEPLDYTYRVDASGPSEKYIIPNKNVDTTTIRVKVQNSYADLTRRSYTLASNLSEVTPESEVFFLEENATGYFEIFFGDNVLGKKLSPGNLVIIEYLISSGSVCNVSSTINQYFTLGISIGGVQLNSPILASSNSTGGDEEDTLEEIKFKAPRFRSSMNRAVTAEDYKAIIEANYPLVESVSVWGGEDNDPPKYGKIMISLKPYLGYEVSKILQDKITNDILNSRKMIGTIPEFVSPNYLHITLETTVRHNTKNSKFDSEQIRALTVEAIQNYFNTELQKFDKDFVYSKLSKTIDDIDVSVIGNISNFRLQKRIKPLVGASNGYNSSNSIKFVNTLVSGSIYSTTYFLLINDEIRTVYFKDALTNDITSTLSVYDTFTDVLLVENIGTVNYETGIIEIPELLLDGYPENITDIRIYAKTVNLDINATKDIILVIDDGTSNSANRRLPGLTVRVQVE